ncbi:hypothetical protein C8Q69DRAFT_502803 [Paecilomyces variotii]|uniref:BHLH domain-containing protein n=1 Tax=Byssochlamys spectabilis TaxID=264951 RepID=A0A443I5I1_BYSSP|nr:hypothetical protein C8Q69DRAFT_502803 [Paecilomyces variotii]KAJ9258580.1 hypothetical protein DTO195F2_5233 [Paecilomyces variotii]KAJ9269772.1 hypothetical protein DTO212C5_4148 [Paecilomyces variotii]KAJ9316857.1 hypothetical protein DTO271D3_2990 [Paecilomyces variotii]KAJ9352748.1 hypothetical protein DTO280E4_7641 [Paecilomyces variotii]KAJ9373860.1 hypothetical protein DTO282E5_1644 [Paecilomyces variotii]
MWKKAFSRPREPVIGSPKLIGTTLNQQSLKAMPRIPGALHDNSTNKSLKSLPPLPVEEEDPDAWTPYPDHPAYRNYDSEDLERDVAGHHSRQQSAYSDIRYSSGYSEANGTPEISPPDSPAQGAANQRRPDSDVSSLEEEARQPVESPQKGTRFSSQIPILRKTARQAPEKTKSDIYAGGAMAREIGNSEQASPAMHHHSFFGRNKDPNRAAEKRNDHQKDSKPTDRHFSASLGFEPRTVTTITSGGMPKKLKKTHVPFKSDKQKTQTAGGGLEAQASSSRLPDPPAKSPDKHLSEGSPSPFRTDNNAVTKSAIAPTPMMARDVVTPPVTGTSNTRPVSEMPSSVMGRRRPVPSSAASIKSTTRKPTPSEFQADKYKSLPMAPIEVKYQSRIDMLEAKREELKRRRISINAIIHELTQAVQPTSTVYDLAARNEIKKTVSSLNDELAEINKEEHDLGLKILRAWKKRDEECVYESGSSLWVKRMTS